MRAQQFLIGAAMASATAIAVVACGGSSDLGGGAASGYSVTNLVSDVAAKAYGGGEPASKTDTDLVNPWGLAFNPAAFAWVADNHTNKSTLYDGQGNKQTLVVTLPADTDPTGIVFNPANAAGDFDGSPFLFDGEGGTIVAWPGGTATTATTKFTAADGAVYKGLAFASTGTAAFIYAADFHNAKVDVFDKTFAKQTALAFPFADAAPPLAGYAPFGIQAVSIGNAMHIVVAYAEQQAGSDDEDPASLGYVNVFSTSGVFERRVTSGLLKAPWGIAVAPPNFGEFSGDLLIGNFGDGRINAFDPLTGNHIGTVQDGNGADLVLDGLWAIAFGNDHNNQPGNALFFTAGPADETHGVYGKITCNGC